NCLADRDLDAVYKPHLTEGVYGLGVGQVTFQAAASAALALALAAHMAWQLDRWVLLAATAVGLVVAWAYSAAPMRLKGCDVRPASLDDAVRIVKERARQVPLWITAVAVSSLAAALALFLLAPAA